MLNDTIDVLKTRRSIRRYKAEPVPGDLLDTVLDAATYAPTGQGAQCPLIVSVTDKATLDKLRKLNDKFLGMSGDPYYGAPNIVIVFANTDRGTWVEDASGVLTYMQVAAKSVGLDSCWIHREREMFQDADGVALKKEWGVPEGYEGVGALALGYADVSAYPKPAPRKDGYVIHV